MIRILSTVYKMSITDLSKELNMRKDSLKLVLKRMRKRGVVVLEEGEENETFVRYTGYPKGEKVEVDRFMYG
ncbi:MAG: MarR family transcriptional regulator [Thermoplasmata archaeon]|nr:MarR family transcriptional regulator [Thermoplasmata archaeon]